MGQETREVVLVVQRTGISDMMRGLEVGTEDKLTALAQSLLHVEAEAFQELILVIQHREIIFTKELFFTPQGTRRQHTAYRHLVKVGLNKATFTISLLVGEPVHDGLREMAGVNANTAILVLLAINKVGLIPLWDEVIVLDLIGTHAVILNADNVSILIRQPVK